MMFESRPTLAPKFKLLWLPLVALSLSACDRAPTGASASSPASSGVVTQRVLACDDPEVVKVLSTGWMDYTEEAASRQNEKLPASLHYNVAAARRFAGAVKVALNGVTTVDTEHADAQRAIKKTCRADVVLTIDDVAMRAANNETQTRFQKTFESVFARDGVKVRGNTVLAELTYSIQLSDDGTQLRVHNEGFSQLDDVVAMVGIASAAPAPIVPPAAPASSLKGLAADLASSIAERKAADQALEQAWDKLPTTVQSDQLDGQRSFHKTSLRTCDEQATRQNGIEAELTVNRCMTRLLRDRLAVVQALK